MKKSIPGDRFMSQITEYSAANLIPLVGVNAARWNRFPSPLDISSTASALEARGIKVVLVDDGAQAIETLKKTIPEGTSVMNGSSATLVEIGYDELLKENHKGWVDLHKAILVEDNDQKRAELRRKSLFADYFISGCNAISKSGEIVGCDTGGSRVGAWHFSSKNLVLVSGVNKIVSTLEEAIIRVKDFVFPLEDYKARKAYGKASQMYKWAILAGETVAGRTTLILINEVLGY
jgi:L-lactate utilization protein LutB